jgi:hypothetical protein
MAELKAKKEDKVIDPVELEAAFTLAKENLLKKTHGRLDNAATSHLDEFGRSHYTHEGNVCHNHMNNSGYKYVVNCLMIGTNYTHSKGRCLPYETELWFVDYIINRSAYSAAFVSKDAEQCLKEQMTISSGDHPSNFMVAGLVALRRLWEYTTVVSVAHSLVQEGVPEDLAFILGHLAQVCEDPTEKSMLTWNACKAGHCSINPARMDFNAVKNFMDHKVLKPKPLWSSGKDSYSGYDAMYSKEDYPANDIHHYVVHNFPYHLYSGKPAPDMGTNPFTASIKKPAAGEAKAAAYPKAIKIMAEWAKTHLMEKITNA